MKLRIFKVLLWALLAAGCGTDGATKFGGPAPTAAQTFGQCAFCHAPMAEQMVASGVVDLKCELCHDDLLPGRVGPGHRSIPTADRVPSFAGPMHALGAERAFGDCAFCHHQFGVNLIPVSSDLQCQTCHDDAQPGHFGPGHRTLPGTDRVPSFAGPSHDVGAAGAFGSCAFCHHELATNMAPVSADLKCETCHDNAQPGRFGPGHRSLPNADRVPSFAGPTHQLGAAAPFGACAFCHNQFATNMVAVRGDLHCQTCHDDAQPGHFGPGHRSLPGPDRVPSFATSMHTLDGVAAFGSCAFCHNQFAVNLTASGIDLQCEFCHTTALSNVFGPGHRSLPGPETVQSFPGPTHELGPEATFGVCAVCHNELAVTLTRTGGHSSLRLKCDFCHSDLKPGAVGPGHRNVPACAACHDQQKTHEDPAAGTRSECVVCHTPHGSTNLFLIREQILTPSGTTRGVQLNNLLGLADGSFASVTRPGTGVCEVCHTETRFFRSDGTGETHFPFPCFTCHPHAGGFAPR